MGVDRSTTTGLALVLAAALCGACGRTDLWPALQPAGTGDGGVDAPAGDAGGGDARSDGHADTRSGRDPCSAAGNPCSAGQRCVPALFRQLPGLPGGPDLVLALGDLNRDGLTDLVTLSPSQGTVSVWLNDISTGFHANGSYRVGNQPIAAAIGDFTGDGQADIAVATFSAGEVTTLVGAGDGTFRMGSFIAAGAQPRALAAVDLNGDGHLDLAVANQDQGRTDDVTLLTSIGSGVFVPGGRYGSRPSLTAIAVGDFNNDGLADIAAASAADASLMIIYNDDVTAPVVYPVPTGARALAAGDFDGDGIADLAVAGNDAIAIFFGAANQPVRTGPVLSPEADTNGLASAVVAGDFDDDGHADLAFANGKQLYILLGLGDGQFQPARALLQLGADTQPTQLAAGDLDGDGVTDLLVGSVGGEIVRFLSTANAVLSPAPSVPTTGGSLSSAAGDFDGDGNIDLAISQFSGQVGVLQLLGDGRGNFPRSHTYAFGSSPARTLAADLDGDGRSDLVVFDNQTKRVGVRIANRDGTLGDLHEYTIGLSSTSLAVLDANEDGHLDLAVPGLNALNGVALLLGKGDGTLQAPITIPGAGGIDIAAADFDGDGHADLATTDVSGLRVFFGDGRANFSTMQVLSQGDVPLAVTAGDTNGDRRPDLITVETVPIGLRTVLVGGDRGLVGLAPAPTRDATVLFAATGDLNGDGRLDVAFDSFSSTVMGLALGNGDGTFRLRRQFPEPGNGSGVIVTDLNNDGRLDVVAVTSDAQFQSPWQLGIWMGAAPFECR